MNEDIIKGQKDNALTLNYNQWIFDKISPYIGNRIVDIGSGLGNFLGYLSERELVIAVDILDIFIEHLRKTYAGCGNIHIFKCDVQSDTIVEACGQYKPDTVICNNMLEHVQDDLRALNNMRRILNDRGNLILVLPAFKLLYGKWDKSVGHYRRYSMKEIRLKLKTANFSIKKSFYINMVGFLGWFLNAKILRNTPRCYSVEGQAIFFDRYIVKPLRKIEDKLKPPFGQSLIVIADPNRN